MNVTPALPNPMQPSARRDLAAVGAVQATRRTRDAADDAPPRRPQPPPETTAPGEHVVTRAEVMAHRADSGTLRASRAMAAYSGVAEVTERSDLRSLLGFDAYA